MLRYWVEPEMFIKPPPVGLNPETYSIKPSRPNRQLKDGDTLTVGNRTLQVLHTPGHSPGSICLWEESAGLLFSGDTIYDDPIYVHLPHSDFDDYVRSLSLLCSLVPQVRKVLPSHGQTPLEPMIILKIAQAFQQVAQGGVEYLFLDGVYESLRRLAGLKEGVLVAWGICRDGQKVLLHMALGNKESYTAFPRNIGTMWQNFIRDMQGRGLPAPILVATDGAPGLIRAVDEAWPNSLRQRCLAQTPALAGGAREIRNVVDKVPDNAREEVKAMVHSTYYAPNREVGEKTVMELLDKHGFNVIPVPLYDVSPFGGGLHCGTADVYREGSMEDYFPKQVDGF